MNRLKKIFWKNNQRGMTLIEILVFVAIFTLISTAFVSILLVVLQVQNRETSRAEVNRQSQFLVHLIQRYVEESSLIETENVINDVGGVLTAVPTSTLVLRMASSSDYNSSTDTFTPFPRVHIYLDNGVVYMKEGDDAAPQALNSDRVIVDRLEFVRRSNPDSLSTVDVTLALHFKTNNIQRQFSQLIQTAIARVNAASFDSDVVPSSTLNNLSLGVLGRPWKSINGIINFAGGNVGIGSDPDSAYRLDVYGTGKPSRFNSDLFITGKFGVGTTTALAADQELTVVGGVRILPNTATPDGCNESTRGTIWFYRDYDGNNDLMQVCQKVNGFLMWYNLLATSTEP